MLYLFADDNNLLYVEKDIKSLESVVKIELSQVQEWLVANKSTLVNAKGWFTRATQTQTQAQGSSHVQCKRKRSAIRKRNRVFQDGGRSRCIGVVVLSLSWCSSNKT